MTQKEALEMMKSGKNCLLTGGPGSGKTYTINQFIKYCRENGIAVEVTASTGIAATHLNGVTIHSWSGMGIKEHFSDMDISNILNKSWVMKKLTSAKVLIIDEVSMLDANFIDNLDRILSIARDGITRDIDKAFGGLQIIFVGDFFQLPPVSKGKKVEFAFDADSWRRAHLTVCYLSEQHRQEDDAFLDVLTSLRSGTLTKEHIDILRSRNVTPENEKDVTQIFTHNIDVDRVNEKALAMIDSPELRFLMMSSGNEYLIETLKKGCLSPEVLKLKVGALVMFTKNKFDRETGRVIYVNGTIGKVVSMSIHMIRIELKNGKQIVLDEMEEWNISERDKVIASIHQFPLRLAWAITVHKSQGMTLDSAIIDLSNSFEYGQGYVALSRVKSLDGLYLTGFNGHSLKVHPEVVKHEHELNRIKPI